MKKHAHVLQRNKAVNWHQTLLEVLVGFTAPLMTLCHFKNLNVILERGD